MCAQRTIPSPLGRPSTVGRCLRTRPIARSSRAREPSETGLATERSRPVKPRSTSPADVSASASCEDDADPNAVVYRASNAAAAVGTVPADRESSGRVSSTIGWRGVDSMGHSIRAGWRGKVPCSPGALVYLRGEGGSCRCLPVCVGHRFAGQRPLRRPVARPHRSRARCKPARTTKKPQTRRR